ncbi:hypothetical protein BZA77DRAFT_307261 [Pyronema omphalodes]|nr:hypothetical protein BZA77DRAFT_307261 [Pyronema omphalodes]
MQFTLTTIFVLISAVSAADIIGYPQANCHGVSVACNGIQENNCCDFKGYNMRSIRWTLPARSRGEAYSHSKCNNKVNKSVSGKTTGLCVNYDSVKSGKWIILKNGKRDEKQEDCKEPNSVGYTDKEGRKFNKRIPDGMADEVLRMVERDEIEGLEDFEDDE